jgi:hypothetical protein
MQLSTNISHQPPSLRFLPYMALLTVNQDSSIIMATAMSIAVDHIYIRDDVRFNILVSKLPNLHFNHLLSEMLKRGNGRYSYNMHRGKIMRPTSTVYLLSNDKELATVEDSIQTVQSNYRMQYRFLIHCMKIDSKNIFKYVRPLIPLDRNNWNDNMGKYLIVNSARNVTLMTYVVRRKPDVINTFDLKLETVNVFNQTTKKWNRSFDDLMKKTEEFTNFNLAVTLNSDVKYEVYNDKVTGKLSGVLIDIFAIVGQKAKFHASCIHEYGDSLNKGPRPGDTELSLYATTKLSLKFKLRHFHVTTTYTEEVYRVVITPPHSLTSYEKLNMPFDKTTWVLLGLTFSSAFIVIAICNKQPRWIQDIVYGKNVRMPGYNIVSIIFGIGQTKLPKCNFPRLILVLFIWFCLIFRTAYVGVLFELLALDIQRPPPQTLLDMMDANFTIYHHAEKGFHDLIDVEVMKILEENSYQ